MDAPEFRDLSQAPILVAEDNHILAGELAAALNERGWRVLGPVATVEAGLLLLDTDRPAGAILDFKLKDETVAALAVQLRRRGIPFVVTSGFDLAALPETSAIGDAINVGKGSPGRAILVLESLVRPVPLKEVS
jgi:ActR/RegA family two-component response regulator